MNARSCSFVRLDGRTCRATPGREVDFCFVHDPARREEATKARRLGGLRRRRAKTLHEVYDVGGIDSTEEIRRYVRIALDDALGLENSVARGRLLLHGATTAARLLETAELQARLERIEEEVARIRAVDREREDSR
jgi:hypothetical protein